MKSISTPTTTFILAKVLDGSNHSKNIINRKNNISDFKKNLVSVGKLLSNLPQ